MIFHNAPFFRELSYTIINLPIKIPEGPKLFSALREENSEELVRCFEKVFAKIPYQIQDVEEKFYHAILQALFVAADMKSHAEYSTSFGRADIVLELPKITYIFEIKVDRSAEKALEQIEERKYFEPFKVEGKRIRAVGLSFSRAKKWRGKRGDPIITSATKLIEAGSVSSL